MLFNGTSNQTTSDVLVWNEMCRNAILEQQARTMLLLRNASPMPSFLEKQLPFGATVEDLRKYYASSVEEIDLTSVLYMVANAEARIRFDMVKRLVKPTDPLSLSFVKLRQNVSQDWNVAFKDGVLNAWKNYARLYLPQGSDVDECVQCIGNFSNVLRVRHWVAHGRYWTLNWNENRSWPISTARDTDKLIDALQKIALIGNISPFV